MKKKFENLISIFRNQGINIAPGLSENDIINLEKKMNFLFPEDYKTYHSISNGFLDWEMDKNNFSIWTFDRIEEQYFENEEHEPDFIPICDYLINSWWYGYVKGRKGIYTDRDSLKPVAKDFEEFLELIITDDGKLYV